LTWLCGTAPAWQAQGLEFNPQHHKNIIIINLKINNLHHLK
jgi:hypothetical protein